MHRAPIGSPMAGLTVLPKWTPTRLTESQRQNALPIPGCWPQGADCCCAPADRGGLLPADFPVTVNGISGYSGGGKGMIANYEAEGACANLFALCADLQPQAPAGNEEIYGLADNPPLFTPAVGNYYKGMLTVVPLQSVAPGQGPDRRTDPRGHRRPFRSRSLAGLWRLRRWMVWSAADDLDPQALNDTNRLRLHVFANDARAQACLIAVYDNLGKGASGAAVQNLNLMLGVDRDHKSCCLR
jgi:N-acetyl-gamma-glutamyl-phosphate reductase